ncbi:MAG: hypothetical protein NVS4B10_22770 [Myxococcales bacterium]
MTPFRGAPEWSAAPAAASALQVQPAPPAAAVEVRAPPAPTVLAPSAFALAAAREREKRASLPTVSIGGPVNPAEAGSGSAAVSDAAPHRARRPAAIHGIGFRPLGQGVVLVRSDRAVEYSVTRTDREVLLHLAAATIAVANNRRPLDTRVFGGPVERIVPLYSRGGTDLRIELRETTEFQVEQVAGLLTVTFTR